MPAASSGVEDRPGSDGGVPDVDEAACAATWRRIFYPSPFILPCPRVRATGQALLARVAGRAPVRPWYRSRRAPRLSRLDRRLSDLGHHLPRHPHRARNDSAAADGGDALDRRRRPADRSCSRCAASACRRAREWPSLAILGILLLGFGNGAVVWAEQTVPSGLTAVLVATSPFWMVGIDALMPDGEAITLRRVLGLVVGFGGIVMLVWPEIRFDGSGRGFLGGVHRGADRVRRMGDRIVVRAQARARPRQRGERARDRGVRDAVRRDRAAGRVARAAARPARLTFTPRTAGALRLSDLRRRDRRVFGLRLRAQAPAGRDGVALRVRESDHRRGAWHAGLERAVQRPDVRRGGGRVRRGSRWSDTKS